MKELHPRTLVPVFLLCLCAAQISAAAAAFPAADFQTVDGGAQFRDVAVAHGAVYVAVYNRNEVWRIDPETGVAIKKQQVGEGPAALAVAADARTIAVANRLSADTTILSLPDLTILSTTKCGEGTCDVTALPGGGFAVTNSFADSVSIMDPAKPAAPVVTEDIASVPVALASSTAWLAVATSVPPALQVYAPGAILPNATVSLKGTPVAVAALDRDRFAVASEDSLCVVDAAKSLVQNEIQLTGIRDLAIDDNIIYTLTNTGLHAFMPSLERDGSKTLPQEAFSIAASAGVWVAASPVQEQLYVLGTAVYMPPAPVEPAPFVPEEREAAVPADEEVAVPVEEAAPAGPEPQSPEPVEVEPAAPAEEPTMEPAPETALPAEPAEPTEKAQPEPAAPSPEPVAEGRQVEIRPEPEESPEGAQQPEEESPEPTAADRRREGSSWRGPSGLAPIAGQETSAPRFSRRRPGLPGEVQAPQTFTEALAHGFDITGAAGGFTAPDWRKPLRDMSAGYTRQEGPETYAEGNVRLSLDTMEIGADKFYYNEESGEMWAEGNITLHQDESELKASRLEYVVPTEAVPEEQPPHPLEIPDPDVIEQETERRRLSLGHLKAVDVEVTEPSRAFTADLLTYDFATEQGELTNAKGIVLAAVEGQKVGLRFGAPSLHVTGPESAYAEDLWVSTSQADPPNYSLHINKATLNEGRVLTVSQAQVKIGKSKTPIFWPKWAFQLGGERTIGFDFDSGRAAELGYFINYAQRFIVDPDLALALRFYPTEKEGVGFGLDGSYDYMKTPTSPLFLGRGQFQTMITTKDSGYVEWYHRHEPFDDTVLLLQWEQWFEPDFVKQFYYDTYRHRTEPRTFANLTYTQPNYIATGTIRPSTNEKVAETERLPEATFHLLETPLAEHLYLTYDLVAGYNEREPSGDHATRMSNVARLSLDLDLHEALSLTPFFETEATWYSDKFEEDDDDLRFSNTVGVTLQTRFHKKYPGIQGFSGFKHVIVPSFTYTYRPEPTMGVEETPRFDALDNIYGRSRFETKLDNMVFGRDAETGEVWQVARLSLYQGNDFWNELRKSDDYEIELDLRPRPWWGVQMVGERHNTSDAIDLDAPFFLERTLLSLSEDLFGRRVDPEVLFTYNAQYADYDRMLGYVYYDDTYYQGGRFNARLGYSYAETRGRVFNREILYGVGYRLNDHWSVAFEHRYDFERDELYRQTYELRHTHDGLEYGFIFRDRTEGWDVSFELTLVAFPGTKVTF